MASADATSGRGLALNIQRLVRLGCQDNLLLPNRQISLLIAGDQLGGVSGVINKSVADLDRPDRIGWPLDGDAIQLRRVSAGSLLVPFGDPLFTANVNTVKFSRCRCLRSFTSLLVVAWGIFSAWGLKVDNLLNFIGVVNCEQWGLDDWWYMFAA